MAVYDFKALTILGEPVSLEKYRGQVLVILNTASACGYTPQYEGLGSLYTQFHDAGLEILAFPCNQFGWQEPGSESDISSFCATKYNVKFPLFSKIDVNGKNAHPLFQYLSTEKRGLLGSKMIKWNFTKFLISRTGEVIKRYSPQTTPAEMTSDIETELRKPSS